MTSLEIKKRINNQLKTLSADRLRVACDFIEYLNENEDNAATKELLKIKGFRDSLRRAERQVAKGQTVPFAKARRDA